LQPFRLASGKLIEPSGIARPVDAPSIPLWVCAIFRDEAPYLREWIEFHRIVGVERFYLYQNRSADAWQEVLQPYLESGLVDLTEWPYGPPCQMEAYRHFIETHRQLSARVAFIDCDEFLFSPCCHSVKEALDGIGSQNWGAVAVNWMCFGASGQERRMNGLVIERFVTRPTEDFAPNLHIKSIVHLDRVDSVGMNPHEFRVRGGTFNELGEEISRPWTARPSHRWLRINHYHTKSRQEYLERIARGKADGQSPRSSAEFDRYQATDAVDTTIWKFLPQLKQRLGGAV
jgi:hypothetical protein